jgi:hypothetical protein
MRYRRWIAKTLIQMRATTTTVLANTKILRLFVDAVSKLRDHEKEKGYAKKGWLAIISSGLLEEKGKKPESPTSPGQ